METIWCASFDIGKKNFAFYIEEINIQELEDIKNIPSKQRYNIDGTPTQKMENILEKIFSNGKVILHDNVDLTANCDPKVKLDPETFHNMIDILDNYATYWDKCSVFVIEEQMAFGSKLNKMAVKLGQHCYSYFTYRYSRQKEIIEFPAYYKTQILGAPKIKGARKYKAMSKPQRKKWSSEKAIEILTNRGELDILDNLVSAKKKDDLADVITQLQAFKYKYFVDV